MIPPELEAELKALRELDYDVEVVVEGQRVYIVFRNFTYGAAYTPNSGELMVFTTTIYPNAGFDMFWTNPDMKLKDGRLPQAGEAIEVYLGRPWRRFSWHLNRPWSPVRDSLRTWMSYVEVRLAKGA